MAVSAARYGLTISVSLNYRRTERVIVDVWVPIIGSGRTQEDARRPDVPTDAEGKELVSWCSNEGAPCELNRQSPNYGKPIADYMCISVRAEDAASMVRAVPRETVPQEHRLLVELCRLVERNGVGQLTRQARGHLHAAFRREAGADKPMLGRLLVRMVRRGLDAETAQHIADAEGLRGEAG